MINRPSQLTTENTVFYSAANTGYAIFSAVSLLAVRKYLPEARLCILSAGLSDEDKRLLDKNGIEYLELDLSHKFTKTWEYPIECFYIFAGPELFCERGFEYSVYIDGDVLCKNNPLVEISEVIGVASASQSTDCTSIFGDDWLKLKELWDISEYSTSRQRINSGVVYFNNQRMKQINLLDKASTLFTKCLNNNIPRKGDDSLLSLLQLVYLNDQDIRYLSPRYNYVLQFNKWQYPIEELVFFHFTVDKPWKKRPYQHEDKKLNIFNPYVKEWRSRLRKTAPKTWLKGF